MAMKNENNAVDDHTISYNVISTPMYIYIILIYVTTSIHSIIYDTVNVFCDSHSHTHK